MDNTPSTESHDQNTGSPEPEVLKPRADDGSPTVEAPASSGLTATPEANKRRRHRTYRPSHKATFIGLIVVVIILAVNAGILGFVLKGKNKANSAASGQVTISSAVLSKIGVNSSTIGDSGIVLTVDPDAQFNGKITVAGNVTVGGQLKLNSTFTASDANLTQLEAGNTALSQLNVNGNTTLSNVSLRNNLSVTGSTLLQGDVNVTQLLTVNGGESVVGNLAVGGVLSVKSFSASSLTSTSTLTVDGHVITAGSAPSVGPGSALGSNGTVSISGDDSAGTINVNIGAGASNGGTLAKLAFANQYGSVPRIVISLINGPTNVSCSLYVLSPSVAGFSVEDNCSLPPGGYLVDYIVEQ